MSKKSKQKQKQAAKQVSSAPKGVSEDVKKEIEALNEEVKSMADNLGAEDSPLNASDESKVAEAEKTEELKRYLKYLQDINHKLNGMFKYAEDKKAEADDIKQKAQEKADNVLIKEEELEKKHEDLNKREQQVLERELQLDNGEYTGSIRSLLDALTQSEKDISSSTKDLIDSLVEKHKTLLSKESEVSELSMKIEEEKKEIEQAKKHLEREKRKMQTDMMIFQEDTKEELEAEYSEKYDTEKSRADRLTVRNELLEKRVEELERLKLALFVVFGDREPQDILNEVSRIREESSQLQDTLNSRPTLEELEGLRKQIDELKVENTRLNGLVTEKEITDLRAFINNSDSYVIEIQGYKDRLESSKNREDSLRRTIEDLKSTVEQLKGEHQKDEEAFQFARKYDADYSLQNKSFRDFNPNSLYEFAVYMQKKIASSDKPFYYDIDTIRKFIAGLNMSSITILQGISGTGKTSLPREFSKAIISEAIDYTGQGKDNSPNAPYRICAVQSGWRDNMDLMGYYNSFEHKYKETEFFKALYLANLPKYSDTLFFIILDEMNLSRPEHYFADFLSLLEQKEDEHYISVNAPDEVLPQYISEGKMHVPENVRFIGTANHDETTLEFAPKTYDRSNLMEMPKNQDRNISPTDESYNVSYHWLKEQFLKAKTTNISYYKVFKKFINTEEFKVLLMEKGIGIGNRFEDQAERFITTFVETGNPSKKDESLAKAADHLIATRLFRTLRNRYDLDKSNLQNFKSDFDKLFEAEFHQEPVIADEMLNSEIDKK